MFALVANLQNRTDVLPLHDDIVYGPVTSRRLGQSLGVNLLPPGQKICNFDCQYCQYGWTRRDTPAWPDWPSPDTVVRALEERLRTLDDHGASLARITLAGHGEPTLHPAFCEIVEALLETRDRLVPHVKLAILSNSTRLNRPGVLAGLAMLDERHMKLDAGEDDLLKRLNGTTLRLSRILRGLQRLSRFTIQAMFVDDVAGGVTNCGERAVARWLEAIAAVKPVAVHVYTLDRAPASPLLAPVSRARLAEIAASVRQIGIPAEVF